jgi:hypothetical protein
VPQEAQLIEIAILFRFGYCSLGARRPSFNVHRLIWIRKIAKHTVRMLLRTTKATSGLEVLEIFRFILIQPVVNLSLTPNTKTSSSCDHIIQRVKPGLSHLRTWAGHPFRQIFSLLAFKSLSVFQLFILFLVRYPLRLHRNFQ